MNKPAFRCLNLSVLVFGLLLSAVGAGAAEEGLRITPKERAALCDGPVTLRSEDLVQQGLVSITKSACHGSVSCQPNYPSCASWSSYSACDAPYCANQVGCGDCNCDEFGICWCERGPARHVPSERFRVCFDQFGNSCTEWQKLTTYSCGGGC